MNIPKIIHYCWFGNNPIPKNLQLCINSWSKYCPDYKIIRWDESNTDLNSCNFIKQAYSLKKWAFVSDYIRLKIIYEYGGIYLDTDVELISSIDHLLIYDGFMGFEQGDILNVNTGLGFGAKKNHSIIKLLMKNYEDTNFIKKDNSLDITPCPERDTRILINLGLKQVNKEQNISNIIIFPIEYFCPMSCNGVFKFTDNTVSIHHYNASWLSEITRKGIYRKRKLIRLFGASLGSIINLPFNFIDTIREKGIARAIQKTINKLK